eukprot:TRINITY_DN527_c0_g1_i1.p1 TRINITY_DN527_c0_g1~~TRINITY_DN527_c0_g1_i1.p1  ORF type:complete len:112 (+),score=9.52 TRINITY_DN527_c0_g1_i1:310-645(+)
MATSGSPSPTISERMAATRSWIVEHKLRSVGTLWASAISGSILYNLRKPAESMSVKIIHARLHAQALTIAALCVSGLVEYYDHQSGEKADHYMRKAAYYEPPPEPHFSEGK